MSLRSEHSVRVRAVTLGTIRMRGEIEMKRWWPLLTAILYVIATFAAVFAVPKAPGVNASGEALVRYYRDNGDTLWTATWLLTWALVPFVILMAHVRTFLSGLCRDVMLISAAL